MTMTSIVVHEWPDHSKSLGSGPVYIIYIQQGSRKIFNLWVLSGKAEDQKKEKRSQADSNGSIYSTNSTIFITT